MKLIKISLFLISIFSAPSLWAEVNANAVILNNQAADKLKATLEKKKPKEDQSFMDKWLDKFMGKKEPQEKKGLPEKPQDGSPENGVAMGSEFSPGQSKKEKEETNINTEALHEAYKKSLEATLIQGDSPEVRMNLGLAFELSGENEKALKSYKIVEKLSANNPAFQFLSRYNTARVLGVEKKVDEALQSYQSALDIYPESKEVKVNIELLLRNQQGGGGGGDKDDQEGGDGKRPKPDAPIKKNPKNSEYKSQKLSKKDVQKILEELKNQEQKIRAKEYDKGVKEKPRDKDW